MFRHDFRLDYERRVIALASQAPFRVSPPATYLQAGAGVYFTPHNRPLIFGNEFRTGDNPEGLRRHIAKPRKYCDVQGKWTARERPPEGDLKLCMFYERPPLAAVIYIWRPCSNGVTISADCCHLTAPLGHSYNSSPHMVWHNRGRYSPMLSLTVPNSNK